MDGRWGCEETEVTGRAQLACHDVIISDCLNAIISGCDADCLDVSISDYIDTRLSDCHADCRDVRNAV